MKKWLQAQTNNLYNNKDWTQIARPLFHKISLCQIV